VNPWLVYKPAINLVGIPLQDGALSKHYDALWDALSARYAEIPYADPDQGYGLHCLNSVEPTYLAALAVNKIGVVPDGMAAKMLPANTYAVFSHHGLSEDLLQTVDRIFSKWLPGSSYQLAGDFYLENYDDRFQPGSAESVVSIYVPVIEQPT